MEWGWEWRLLSRRKWRIPAPRSREVRMNITTICSRRVRKNIL
jgi:hypothetical protein